MGASDGITGGLAGATPGGGGGGPSLSTGGVSIAVGSKPTSSGGIARFHLWWCRLSRGDPLAVLHYDVPPQPGLSIMILAGGLGAGRGTSRRRTGQRAKRARNLPAPHNILLGHGVQRRVVVAHSGLFGLDGFLLHRDVMVPFG